MDKRPFLSTSLVLLIFLLGSFFRFYKLDWGEGLFAHPDEYHIVASVNQLSFPTQMRPHFFSYGTAVIYPIYFTKEVLEKFGSQFNPFLIGRLYSALFSSLTILLIYAVARSILSWQWGILAMLLVAVTPGLIQQAHFATPESMLTFFLLAALFFVLRYSREEKLRYILQACVMLGLALGVKINGILFGPPLFLAIVIKLWRTPLRAAEIIILSFFTIFATFFLVTPYVFLDYASWWSTINYEGSLALGKLPVFYTRQFIDTTPILFQIEKILPFTLGLPLLIISLLGLVFLPFHLIRNFKIERLLIAVTFFFLFLPNALLFTKWTRFIVPTFPFFAIFAALFLSEVTKKFRRISYVVAFIVVAMTILWTMAFFSIYSHNDVRITASQWLGVNIAPNASFLVEGGNTVDLPLHGNYQRASLDFYALEEDPLARQKIINALLKSDYFLVQSRRVFYNHQRLPRIFPKTANFYNALFDGSLGFAQIKEFRSYPQLEVGSWKLEVPDEVAEETWSVFDHPVIRVFKKVKPLTKEKYARFLED